MKGCAVFSMVVALWVTWQTPASPAVPAKDFTLPSATDGSLVRLSDYAGKVVLINWWRTSCAWSPGESDRLAGLYSKYHAKGFEIIGISDDTSASVGQVPAYLKAHHVSWPIVLNDQGEVVRDLVRAGHQDTPQNFLVSRGGSLVSLGLDRTPDSWRQLEDAVAAAIAEPVPAAAALHREPLPPAPPLSLPDLAGKTVNLSASAGHPAVVNFFTAQTCAWAGATFAALQRVMEEPLAALDGFLVKFELLHSPFLPG